jgi:hypothetical protein
MHMWANVIEVYKARDDAMRWLGAAAPGNSGVSLCKQVPECWPASWRDPFHPRLPLQRVVLWVGHLLIPNPHE